MLKRIITVLVAFPIAILLVALAVINRHEVTMVLDPFKPQDPALVLAAPRFAFMFGTLLVGVVIGGVAVWMGQGRWRKTARTRAQEVRRWQAEANRLTKERDAQVAGSSGTDLALTHH